MLPSQMTRAALHAHYREGQSPAAVATSCVERIAATGDPGIFLHICSLDAINAAVEALPPFDPERFPLWGLPFAIKDNIDLAGAPTTAACPAYARMAERSAFVVDRLVAAGAIPIGKTNLDQFATGLVGVRTPYPVPRNPFDATRVPGGSSSGSAVAVARALVTFSLGTDTAGSGRIPAALNNLVGLKPSLGALSTSGVVPACRTLDCVSIFATTVKDAGTVFECAVGFDKADAYSRPLPTGSNSLRKLGIPRRHDLQFFGDTHMAAAWTAALSQLDMPTVEIDMEPFFDVARLLYEGPWVAERRAAVGVLFDRDPEAVLPVTRKILSNADRFSAVDTFAAFYKLAELRRTCAAILDDLDALVVPTAPVFPTLNEIAADPIGPNSRLGTYTNFVNLLDLSAIAVPGPFRSDGLPAGVTFIAVAGSESALCDIAGRLFPGIGGYLHPSSREVA
jgi:allophanate hydrolase